MNGLEMPRGGTHVNVMVDSVCKEAREKLVKKYKTIKPGDIKSRICAVVLLTGFKNPEFDAQNKEQLTNAVPAITAHLDGKLDFEKIAKDLIKTEAISDPIIEMFKLDTGNRGVSRDDLVELTGLDTVVDLNSKAQVDLDLEDCFEGVDINFLKDLEADMFGRDVKELHEFAAVIRKRLAEC